jgi:hypothetical protein
MIISSFNTKASGNGPKAKPTSSNLSPEVGSLLKVMMKSSKLSHQQQKVLDNALLNKGLLPLSLERSSFSRQDFAPVAKPHRRQMRSLQTIIDSGDFQLEPYRSVPVKSRHEEIERFSDLMSGVCKTDDLPKRTRVAQLEGHEEINEIEMCLCLPLKISKWRNR